MSRTYIETFDNGPGGWIDCIGNGDNGVRRPDLQDGALVSTSPWWVDYNHAPPGAGYLHLLGALHTTQGPNFPATFLEAGGPNRFVEGGFPTDFTNARLTLRLRGEVDLRGAQMLFLMQAKVGDLVVGHLLTGQPFEVTPEWSEQTVTLSPDPAQWTCLGVRHDRTETYGRGDVEPVLRDLNCDILFVLHPLDVVPLEPVENPHLLKAGEEFPVDRSRLPQGYIAIDEIRIEFTAD
jgi:hypothetical protein